MKTHQKPNGFRYLKAARALVGASIAALALTGCQSGVPLPPPETDAATSERQKQAFVEALKPRRPGRPVIAVLASNEATETTDFMVSHAMLQRADVADVQAVAPRRGRVRLYPVFEVEVAQDFSGFDRAHPAGADYVIVPALDDTDDPAVIAWLQQQAAKGARIISVCAGALIVGKAGLLDDQRFTTHWYFRDTVLERHPGATYVPHQRYVVDRDVATTTGVTASIPAMLALIEAIGGRQKAQALAAELGVTSWTPVHDSSLFGLSAGRRAGYLLAKIAFWRNEHWSVEVRDGMDDIALALAADAWSRTGYISVAASAPGRVQLRSGLTLQARPAAEGTPRLPLAPALTPVQQLERTLCQIGERYGESRREWVMLEMEYDGPAIACPH